MAIALAYNSDAALKPSSCCNMEEIPLRHLGIGFWSNDRACLAACRPRKDPHDHPGHDAVHAQTGLSSAWVAHRFNAEPLPIRCIGSIEARTMELDVLHAHGMSQACCSLSVQALRQLAT